MKPVDNLVLDDYISRTVKSKSICSKLTHSFKLIMFSFVFSIVLTLLLVFRKFVFSSFHLFIFSYFRIYFASESIDLFFFLLTIIFPITVTNYANCLPKFSLIVQRKYVDGCLNDGLYGSERACNEYYSCENGIPIPHSCENGKEWSTVNNKCVPRSQSDCSNMFYCPKPFGKFRNELHCDTFYACYFNQPYIIYCPPPFLWSSKTESKSPLQQFQYYLL